ncbi:hypothetical protein AURDEDRAFT_112014 [Auricularia subglabra TFB-10046 SS5]|nr:hypothetical protein AURDEDRAFT_112014 [Auricularia subglabra TFB-10046 SS5]
MLTPTRIARGIFDEHPDLAGALAADPDAPAVAFPAPTNAVACAPVELVWFYSGDFPDDATLDITITNVGVVQRQPDVASSSSPSATATSDASAPTLASRDALARPFWSRHFRRQGPQDPQDPPMPVTATLVHATPIRTTNHSVLLPQLRVPPGYYYSLQGSSVDSTTNFYPSARFLVAEGGDMSCLQSSPTTTLSSSSGTLTPSPTPSSPSGSKESATAPDPSSNDTSKGTIIAGAVGGALAVAVLLATFFAVRHFRRKNRKYSNVDAIPPSSGWGSSQAVAHAASPGPFTPNGGALSTDGTFATPFFPPTVISPAVASPGDSPPAPFTPPPSAPLSSATTPPGARTSFLAGGASISDSDLRKKLSTTPSTWTSNTAETHTSSFNAQLGEAFVVPVTPAIVHDGVMSRQSSVGSGRNVGPAIISPPAQTATAQFVTLPADRSHLDVPSPAFSQTSNSRSSNGTIISTSQALQMLSRGT